MNRRSFIALAAGAVLCPQLPKARGINLRKPLPWRNYTAPYTEISKEDLIQRMKVTYNRPNVGFSFLTYLHD